jgi:hypothetical protein
MQLVNDSLVGPAPASEPSASRAEAEYVLTIRMVYQDLTTREWAAEMEGLVTQLVGKESTKAASWRSSFPPAQAQSLGPLAQPHRPNQNSTSTGRTGERLKPGSLKVRAMGRATRQHACKSERAFRSAQNAYECQGSSRSGHVNAYLRLVGPPLFWGSSSFRRHSC